MKVWWNITISFVIKRKLSYHSFESVLSETILSMKKENSELNENNLMENEFHGDKKKCLNLFHVENENPLYKIHSISGEIQSWNSKCY